MTVHALLRKRVERHIIGGRLGQVSFVSELKIVSGWIKEFTKLMLDRLLIGSFRYGQKQNPRQGPSYDQMTSIINRARAYQIDGNDEHLVDIANLALIEFYVGRHPLKHFSAQDDAHHCEKIS